MRLLKNPRSIKEALFQTVLVRLVSVSEFEARVQIGGKRFPIRHLTFVLNGENYYEDLSCTSFLGPPISPFLFREAKVSAFINIRFQRDKIS